MPCMYIVLCIHANPIEAWIGHVHVSIKCAESGVVVFKVYSPTAVQGISPSPIPCMHMNTSMMMSWIYRFIRLEGVPERVS